jgi:hypothetical protein
MYDQTVRNYSGGQMAEFLKQPELVNEKYVIDRLGYVARSIVEASKEKKRQEGSSSFSSKLKSVTDNPSTDAEKIGSFRLGGEIHMWMYDRFSLSRLLFKVGFEEIKLMNPFESDIPKWSYYELDVKDGAVFDPTSLFLEARKPRRGAT